MKTPPIILFMGVLLFLPFAALSEEPFSGVYVHPSQFLETGLTPEEREAKMNAALDAMRDCGFTTVIPYANTTSGSVHWPGTALPMAGGDAWDALGVFARNARQRGLKVMPAFCVLSAGHDAPAGILESHPEWALRDASGKALGWISPAHKSARTWLIDLIVHMIDHIQADGIMLDYMRFPSQGNVLLDENSMTVFEKEAPEKESVQQRQARMQQRKEKALTQLMTELGETLRKQYPALRIGLYSWGANVSQSHPIAQCWADWARMGYLDLLNVSGYCYRDNYKDDYLRVFEERLRDAAALARSTGHAVQLTFALGIRTSHGAIPSAEEIPIYLNLAQQQGYSGVAAFAWKSLELYIDSVKDRGYFQLL